MLRASRWLLRARRHLVQSAGRARARRGLARARRTAPGRAAAGGGDRPGRDGLPGLRGDRARPADAGCGRLHDIPAFGAPVELVWRQRRYRCVEPACPVGGFSEDHLLAGPRAKLTVRAAWWAISCIQRDTASVAAVARRLGVDWHTVWEAIKPLLAELADDPARLAGVDTLGVDEHIWHHQPRPGKGPKELTGIVDLTRRNGEPQARLLDLVPGRSGKVYADWLTRSRRALSPPGSAPPPWIRSAATATRSATSSKTRPPYSTPSTWCKLGLHAMEETRRRVQQEQLGHRGRKHDPLYQIRNVLRAGVERLTARQIERIETGLHAGDPDYEVTVAWRCYQQLRSAYHAKQPGRGHAIAVKILDTFPTCPIPEIARLGRTLRAWRTQFLAYFTTGRANNGGTEAINGIIELHRRIARGFRNLANYRLRMILAAGRLTHPNLR